MNCILKKVIVCSCLVSTYCIAELPTEYQITAKSDDSQHKVRVVFPDTPLTSDSVQKIAIIRHAPTSLNEQKIVQGGSKDGYIVLDKPLFEANCLYSKLKAEFGVSRFYSSQSIRASSTAWAIDGDLFSKNCTQDPRLNEQKLGILEGRLIKEVMESHEFNEMVTKPSYEVKDGESGLNVINRLIGVIYDIAHSDTEKPAIIISSQCAMNWMYRLLSRTDEIFQKINNLEGFVILYNIKTDEIKLLTSSIISATDAIQQIYPCTRSLKEAS